MKRILVTGVNGFVGRNIVKQWLNKYELIGIDLPEVEVQDAKWSGSINHVDIRDNSSYYKELLVGVDTVIHLAAKTRIDPSWTEYYDYYYTNIAASQSVFAACQEAGVKQFIYFSSSSVYGNNGQMVQTEGGHLEPSSPYAVSKLAAEWALKAQALKGDTELIVVRPFTMYGDYMNYGRYSLAIAKFLKAAANGQPLIIEGTGSQRRDFVHVDDAIAALELIMKHGRHGDVYNIGTGRSVSVQELADAVSSKQVRAPARTGAVEITCADISKLTALGYKPKVDILQWLTMQVKESKIKEISE